MSRRSRRRAASPPSRRFRRFVPALRFAPLGAALLFLPSCQGGGPGGPTAALPNLLADDTSDSSSGGPRQWVPRFSGTTELLWSVWGSGDEIIAVGDGGTAVHAFGRCPDFVPVPTGVADDLCDVWTSSSTEAVACGLGGTVIAYDGAAWSDAGAGAGTNLFDAFGFDTGEVFTVGESGTVLRNDGAAWAPLDAGTHVSLFGVWGAAPDDVLVVGVGGTVKRFDGSGWTFLDSPAVENLNAVFGLSPQDVWAVGDRGTVIRYDGAEWTEVPTGLDRNLYDVWGSDPNNLWVVGELGTVLHWDGDRWTMDVTNTMEDLQGVWGRTATDVWVVGARGTILTFGPRPEVFWHCHDHPDGNAAPPAYGLRLDDLLGSGPYTFSFDHSDGDEQARVRLDHLPDQNAIRIHGRAFGGRDTGGGWDPEESGWIDIDFRYTTNLTRSDDCTQSVGDDFYVTGESALNAGTVTLDGWGGDATFRFTDKADSDGCSFSLDNDRDPAHNAGIAADPGIWSGAGWLKPHVGARDWLFIAEKVVVAP